MTLRPLVAGDRARVAAITRATGVFHEDEVAVALEVFDAGVAGDPSYVLLGADEDDELAAWICWGPTPCTAGTWDLYWLAVDPARQQRGLGRALVREMEHRLHGVARLIVVETAGRADYAGTRAFYERCGYRAAARIPDFYAPGDDQVVYLKSL
ncbi:MAG TPA: GNAT family N-acetyltransferase [Gemmatimonadales bacterium]|nr:GNAT family N-acetyltransferase [Gemmatimonadales bacterium]